MHFLYNNALVYNVNIKTLKNRVQLASPHRTPYIHTKRMLQHCHNGPFIFLVILNSVTLTRKVRAPWGWYE